MEQMVAKWDEKQHKQELADYQRTERNDQMRESDEEQHNKDQIKLLEKRIALLEELILTNFHILSGVPWYAKELNSETRCGR